MSSTSWHEEHLKNNFSDMPVTEYQISVEHYLSPSLHGRSMKQTL